MCPTSGSSVVSRRARYTSQSASTDRAIMWMPNAWHRRPWRWITLAIVAGTLVAADAQHTASGQQEAGDSARVRHPTIDDLLDLRDFNELALSPDGHWAAYTTRAVFGMSATTGAKPDSGHITILDLRQHLERTVKVSSDPHGLRWSPVGSTLAFMAPVRGRNRIWRYTQQDTIVTPQVIAGRDSLDGNILTFAWSATGEELAYLAAEPDTASHLSDSTRSPPRLVIFHDAPGDYTGPTSPTYSRDSNGAYVAIMDADGGPARTLGRHVVSVKYSPTLDWSSTGILLVSGAPIGVSWIQQLTLRPLYTLDQRTGAMRHVRPEREAQLTPIWSPAGKWLAVVDYESFLKGDSPSFVLRLESPTRPVEIVLPRGAEDPSSALLAPMWSKDDHRLYVIQSVRGTNRLFAVDVENHRWRAITPDTLSISQYAVSRDGTAVLGVLESANQPPEIFRIDPMTGALTRLTYESENLPQMKLGRIRQVAWTSGDGRFTVRGFLVKPPDYDPARRYPLVVMAHGGPGALYMNTFTGINFPPSLIPPQLLAAAGFVVLLPNPRGDPSYGTAFQRAIRGAWGTGPFTDIDAGVSMLIKQGLVDSTAIGIAGASYGGYLAAYAISHSQRFSAASIDDAPVDLTSEYGQNYATRSLWSSYFGGTPWIERGLYASQSPITYVQSVRTPVLMRYGGRSDTHDNIRQAYMLAQGFEFYAGLRDSGVPVKFLLHPDQGHGIGDWRLYKDWVMENVRWFGYWLRHEGTNPVASPNNR